MNIKQIVAANIRFTRKKLELTQAQAATRIQVTQQTWQQYESGNQDLRIETLSEIANALETNAFTLMSQSGNTVPKAERQAVMPKRKAA